MSQAEIGLIGLGVMGANLALRSRRRATGSPFSTAPPRRRAISTPMPARSRSRSSPARRSRTAPARRRCARRERRPVGGKDVSNPPLPGARFRVSPQELQLFARQWRLVLFRGGLAAGDRGLAGGLRHPDNRGECRSRAVSRPADGGTDTRSTPGVARRTSPRSRNPSLAAGRDIPGQTPFDRSCPGNAGGLKRQPQLRCHFRDLPFQ